MEITLETPFKKLVNLLPPPFSIKFLLFLAKSELSVWIPKAALGIGLTGIVYPKYSFVALTPACKKDIGLPSVGLTFVIVLSARIKLFPFSNDNGSLLNLPIVADSTFAAIFSFIKLSNALIPINPIGVSL